MRILMLPLILFIYSCQPTPPAEEPETLPEQEQLIYIASRGDGFDLYTFDLERKKEYPFAHALGWEWGPQFIQEKELVIYNSQDTSGNFQLRAADINGVPVDMALPDLPNLLVSPDGNWIVYSRSKDEVTQLLLAPLDRLADSLLITPDSAYHGRAKWSWDSQQIAFVSDRNGTNEVYRYSLEDQSTQQLTDNTVREKYLSWSPDGQQIATSIRTDSTENEIALINVESQSLKVITDTPINESELAWSPSGRYIAYHAKVDEADDIFLLEVATGKVQKITNGNGYHGEPGWILKNNR